MDKLKKDSKIKALGKMIVLNTKMGKTFVQGFETAQQDINRVNNLLTAGDKGWTPTKEGDDFIDSKQLDELKEIKEMLSQVLKKNI